MGCCAVFAALHLPRELEAAIALDRGGTAASKHDYANAVIYYNTALAFYPKAPLVWGRLAVAAARAGDKATEEHALSTLADLAKDDPKSDAGRELFKATMEANGGQP